MAAMEVGSPDEMQKGKHPLVDLLPLGMTVKILSGKTEMWRDCTIVQHGFKASALEQVAAHLHSPCR